MGSDNDRRELHAALEQLLGERPATILMELLPPQRYPDLVTRDEFRAGIAEVRGEIAELRGEVGGVRGEVAELRGEIGGVRGEVAELRGEIVGIRGEMHGLLGKFIAATIPMMFGFAGLVLAAVKVA